MIKLHMWLHFHLNLSDAVKPMCLCVQERRGVHLENCHCDWSANHHKAEIRDVLPVIQIGIKLAAPCLVSYIVMICLHLACAAEPVSRFPSEHNDNISALCSSNWGRFVLLAAS